MTIADTIQLRDDVTPFLDKLGDEAERFAEEFLDAAGEVYVNTYLPRLFDSGGALAGRTWKVPLSGGQPLQRDGTLRDSFVYEVFNGELSIYTPMIYARVRQEGTTVKPVNKKKIAIPLPTLSHSEMTLKPLDFKKISRTFVQEAKNGKLYIFRQLDELETVTDEETGKSVKRRKIEPIFKLVDEVVQEPNPFLEWTEMGLNLIDDAWADKLDAILAEIGG